MADVLIYKGTVIGADSTSIWQGTRAEYDALETYDENTLYVITDEQLIDDTTTSTSSVWSSSKVSGEINKVSGGVYRALLTTTVTLPAGSSATQTVNVNVKNLLVAQGITAPRNIHVEQVYLGNYILPYINDNGTCGTWAYSMASNNDVLVFKNRAGAWDNFNAKIVCRYEI